MPGTAAAKDERLKIKEDLDFQVRMKRLQDAGKGLLGLFLAAALAGLFGPGLLSRRENRDKSGVSVRFDQFGRLDSDQTLEIEAKDNLANRDRFQLLVDSEWLRSVLIESISPEPERQSVFKGKTIYEIRRGDTASGLWLLIRYRPADAGWLRANFEVGGGKVVFEQFIYP